MAEETKKSSSDSPKTDDTENKEKAPDKSVKDLTGSKFETPEALAKAYKELESKLGEQSEEVRQSREFMTVAEPVFEVIRKDPELFKTIDDKLRNTESKDNSKDEKSADKTTDQEDVRSTTREILLKSFENKHGIDKLSADERRKLKGTIGNVITELTGTNLDAVDLRRLDSVLENAYTLAKSRIEDKSTLEAIATAEKSDEGSIPSVPASSGKEGKTLTPEEAQVAERLGLSRDEYNSGKTE